MTKKELMARQTELTDLLIKANASYEQDIELMTNKEYDALYDELLELEKQSGAVLPNSPTQHAGADPTSSKLTKQTHETPMLSLDKTKDIATLSAFVLDQESVLSFKLDGLTVVLTYEDGSLLSAVTRGNGIIGEVITENAKNFVNVPATIPTQDKLVIRGEACITYSDFVIINDNLKDRNLYKNPRNLCSGTVRNLDPSVLKSRPVHFYAFSLVNPNDVTKPLISTITSSYEYLANLGFDVVPHVHVTSDISSAVESMRQSVETSDIPSDGLVCILDDIAYGNSLGMTTKYPRNALAFKWGDETKETTLLEIEWSPSRTGLLNPVAIFEPVELEGTTVTRASLHNVSIAMNLQLDIGDTISVYKANMIIPQVAENITKNGTDTPFNTDMLPKVCPVCGQETTLVTNKDVTTLNCLNENCPAKRVKAFEKFVSRDALNIEGLSEQTLEKFINAGFLNSFDDIFTLPQHKDAITQMDGFGVRSYDKLMKAIDKAKSDVTPFRLIYALGIPHIGHSVTRDVLKSVQGDFDKAISLTKDELLSIDGIGEEIAISFTNWMSIADNQALLNRLTTHLDITSEPQTEQSTVLDGLTFVITGSVTQYPNRKALAEVIANNGGKVSSSISAKTSYLINNDVTSNSSKNKKARDLGIEIINEDEFNALLTN